MNVPRRARYDSDGAVERFRGSVMTIDDQAKHTGYCEQLAGNAEDSSR